MNKYERFHEQAETIFFSDPNMTLKTLQCLLEDDGIKLDIRTLKGWCDKHKWIERRKKKNIEIEDLIARAYEIIMNPKATSHDMYAANDVLKTALEVQGTSKAAGDTIEVDPNASLEDLEVRIDKGLRVALIVALEELAKDPTNKGLAEVMEKMKALEARRKPKREIAEYVVKFARWTVNYFISIGDNDARERFQKHLTGENNLPDYLRMRVQNG